MSQEEDPELQIIKARKMKQMKEKAKLFEKMKEDETKAKTEVSKIDDKQVLLKYLYDRGDEVLKLAESQFPVQTRIIINRISPIPRCTVTSCACNFSTITNAPRVIWPTTNAAAIIDAIFVDLLVSCDFKVKNMVTNTIMPVVAATVL